MDKIDEEIQQTIDKRRAPDIVLMETNADGK
jgi:hypothetical protein